MSVILDGRPVVDLWAGWADVARTRPWREDTLVNVFSVGKAFAAACLLMLVARGRVELDEPVARHWPEFAAAGKDAVTVRQLLSHRAGLAAIRRELPTGALYDWTTVTAALAEEEPWWAPGSAHGYHVHTFGFLVGELVPASHGRLDRGLPRARDRRSPGRRGELRSPARAARAARRIQLRHRALRR